MANENLTPDQLPKEPPLSPSSEAGLRQPQLKPRDISSKRTEFFITALPTTSKKTVTAEVRTAQVGQIFVIENPELDYNLATKLNREVLEAVDPGGDPRWCMCDWVEAYKEFRTSYGDGYDFVEMVPDIQLEKTGKTSPNSMPNFQSHHVHVFNNVAGIHYDYGDYYNIRPYFDSTRLQGIAALPSYLTSVRMMRLHELGHRWGAYVWFKKSPSDQSEHHDLINDDHHWSLYFDSGFSSMVGMTGGTHWIDNHDGTFSKEVYLSDDQRFSYCPLDLYLMGMLTPEEVGDFFYVNNPQQVPNNPTRYSGTRVDLEVKNIEWAHGPRQPDAAHSQRTFRLACVVLTKNLADGINLAGTLQQDRIAVTNEFREATRSRGLLDTYLYKSSYDGIYMKHHDLDTGVEPRNGVFWNSPDIWVRNVHDGLEINQDIKPDQDNWVYVRVRNNGGEPSGELTVNLFQSEHSGTEFLYPQDWMWVDNHRIDESQPIPSVPAGGEMTVCFKWDQSQVASAVTGHRCLLAEILPIHPTKTKLRYVWEDRRIAQKNVIVLNPTPGSTDLAFPFTIGAYTLPPRSVRIRVEQKDDSRLGEVSLDLGEKTKAGEIKTRGGRVIEPDGPVVLIFDDIRKGGDVALPLSEGERKTLILRISWDKTSPPKDVRFEITQLTEQYEVVGGLDLLIGK